MELTDEQFYEKMEIAEEEMSFYLSKLLEIKMEPEVITFSLMHQFVKCCIAFGDDQEDFRLRLKVVMTHFDNTFEWYRQYKEGTCD